MVKALGREDENLKEFSDLTDNMYKVILPGCLAFGPLPADRADRFCICAGCNRLVWQVCRVTNQRFQCGKHPCIRFLPDLYDLAGSGPGAECMPRCSSRLHQPNASSTWSIPQPEIKDLPEAIPAETMLGEIEFDHVDFHYEDRKPVLTDFSLKVKPGEMIALVGPTGGGKTTIVNLLCRFYEPKKGVIRINGQGLHGLHPAIHPQPGGHRPANPTLVFRIDPGKYPLWASGCKRR